MFIDPSTAAVLKRRSKCLESCGDALYARGMALGCVIGEGGGRTPMSNVKAETCTWVRHVLAIVPNLLGISVRSAKMKLGSHFDSLRKALCAHQTKVYVKPPSRGPHMLNLCLLLRCSCFYRCT